MNTLVMIMAGGASEDLSVLTAMRAEPAIPFGGKFRIIDFPLSNCVNSDLYLERPVVSLRTGMSAPGHKPSL